MSKKIIKHFHDRDPILYQAYQKIKNKKDLETLFILQRTSDPFQELVEIIINQQLSGKAAKIITERIKKLFNDEKITPEKLLKIKNEKIREAGTSNSKVKFMKDLAEKVLNNQVNLEKIERMTNEEVFSNLIKVKGLGPWSIEMFLMFSLGREDVFSHGDLGLKNALKKLYKLDNPTKDKVEAIINQWSPFKTYACRILWKSLELK